MDFEKAIEDAIKTGKVKLGSEETKKAIEKEEAELVILAENCPNKIMEKITKKAQEQGIRIMETKYNNHELGTMTGRPHSVASLSIIDPGKSGILGKKTIGEGNE